MRLRDLRTSEGGVAADVVWEQAPRPPSTLFFRTIEPFVSDLEPRAEAFVTAVLWPAWEAGEARIEVEGALCPRLRDGLRVVQQVLDGWYDVGRPFILLEPTAGWRAPEPVSPPRTGMFLSGGVDSLALLRQNRDAFPLEHPRGVRDAFFVHGLDIGLPGQDTRMGFYERTRAKLQAFAARQDLPLIPVWTNVRHLERKGRHWLDAFFGLGMVSVAHAFSGRISEVLVAASLDVQGLASMGSHPLLDPYFSSGALDVRHDGLHPSRLEKIEAVSAWPGALDVLRVCYQDTGPDGPLNCGACRKCVRVMLGLLALGRLAEASTFPDRDLGLDHLEVCTVDRHTASFYASLLDPLTKAGRGDLAGVLKNRLRLHRWRGVLAGLRPC